MYQLFTDRSFDRWRSLARQMLCEGVPPAEILWADREEERSLLATAGGTSPLQNRPTEASEPGSQNRPTEGVDLGLPNRPTVVAGSAVEPGWQNRATEAGGPGLQNRPTEAGDPGLQNRPTEALPVALRNKPTEAGRDLQLRVPSAFVELAKVVACHRDPDRWNLLYRSLWRLTHGTPELLERLTDDDVYRLHAMEKDVRRDRHKMTAFVRFRRLLAGDDVEQYVAWHRPDHYIVRLTAPFFRGRFAAMHWTILTPDDSVTWDTEALHFGPGVPESQAPRGDELESLWRTYYANIFNPARIKIGAMKKELPVRHWPTLPETQLIPDLLAEAPRRVQEMMRKAKENARPGTGPKRARRVADDVSADNPLPGTDAAAEGDLFGHQAPSAPPNARRGKAAAVDWGAEKFIPESRSLKVIAEASKGCRGCDLCEIGTQTVFGEGPKSAMVMFVGEQPGDQEDRAGRPFVGPAGQLLDEVLEQVGIIRDECYVTNAVKHFKWEPRGTRRIHAKPSAREVSACQPWLVREIELVQPKILVCLGSTAAQSLLGRDFRVTQRRGEVMQTKWSPWTVATIHPSALLRIPDEAMRASNRKAFVEDLQKVAAQVAKLKKAG